MLRYTRFARIYSQYFELLPPHTPIPDARTSSPAGTQRARSSACDWLIFSRSPEQHGKNVSRRCRDVQRHLTVSGRLEGGAATVTDHSVGLVPAVRVFPTHHHGAVRVVRHVLADTAQSALIPTSGDDELGAMLSGRLYDRLSRPVSTHRQDIALDLQYDTACDISIYQRTVH